ncbi:MAG: hypothetical protein WAM30_20755, partial [Candidatus Dormiibacterota bacterium]
MAAGRGGRCQILVGCQAVAAGTAQAVAAGTAKVMTGLTAPDRYTVVARTSQPAGYAEMAVAMQSASILDHHEVGAGATHRAALVTSRDQP